jgi:hypothetical protein
MQELKLVWQWLPIDKTFAVDEMKSSQPPSIM